MFKPYNKSNKYHNRKIKLDGITFDSMAEADYYALLLWKQKAGIIKNLQLQVPFELIPAYTDHNNKKVRAVKYVADFVFERDNKMIIVDVKGTQTKEFIIKWKLLGYKYPEYVREIVTRKSPNQEWQVL